MIRIICKKMKGSLGVIIACIFLLCQCGEVDTTLPKVVDFNFHIRPILSQNCYTCHGPDPSSRKAGLRLDTYDGATAKLTSGNRAIVAGNAGRSELMKRITSTDPDLVMPTPEAKKVLTPMEVALIEKWIDQGAKWKKHWSFISPQETKLQCDNIDQYINEAQSNKGLVKGEEASRNALTRRVSYIATGLPPSPDEIQQFETAPYEEIVDYYLASDHFGEHWARHWMDLVRYAEGMGHEFDFKIGGAWHYRDYLIRAFNEDVPYDMFVKEHLAGDLLDSPRINSKAGYNESVIGTAYAFLGEGKHSPVDIKKEESDRMDNLIDVTSKTFQGLTISCAKCHDHKFDPIPTTDYYAMYGMFESSRIGPVAFASHPEKAEIQQDIKEINDRLKSKVAGFIENIDLEKKEEASQVAADFRASDFGDWYTTGDAFGDKPLFGRYVSSRYYGSGIAGVLRSPNFTIQDSFIYVYGAGHGSTIRVIVDNFQLIQNPLYGNFSRDVNNEKWQLHKLNMTSLIGHKAYVEILPGHYNRHHYEVSKDDYIEVQAVFMANASLSTEKVDSISGEFDSEIAGLFEEKAKLSEQLYDSSFVMGMSEGDPVFSPVFIRGSHTELSDEVVPHGFISAVADENKEFTQDGSGRLVWAEAVVDPGNPLTSRVMVNRIWHHIFGKGIVQSVDNFGLQGSLPSHPELLDFLAVSFMENGWSVKTLIREIMLSETFRTSTVVDEKNASLDPQNVHLASFPVRRLNAESIRDGIMATAGTIDKQLYGESVPVHLTEFMTGRGRPAVSGPLDGYGRRSIYQGINRNFLSPMMLTFDMPIPFSTFGKRNTTNVPAQSLILMNDPFVHDQSEKWAQKVVSKKDEPLEKKVEGVFLAAYGRVPSASEVDKAKVILGDFESGEEEVEAWKNYCHIIFNTKEFIHLL